jgi:hypothetical protein
LANNAIRLIQGFERNRLIATVIPVSLRASAPDSVATGSNNMRLGSG